MTIQTAAESDKQYLTTREVADMLGISVRSVQLWVENDVLQAWKTAGGHRRITRASVESFMDRQRQAEVDTRSGSDELLMLVVEDQLEMLELYRRQVDLWNLPIKLEIATDGIEGLYRIGQLTPQVIIADLNIPGLDGVRMIRMLSQEPTLERIRIVVVTSMRPEEIENLGGLPEGIEVFEKPVPFDTLRTIALEQISKMGISVLST